MSETEEWRPVVGWEGLYEVSSLGRVRSLDRRVKTWTGTRSTGVRILRPSYSGFGYAKYMLSRNDDRWYTNAHTLVAMSFLGARPSQLHEVNHIDGDPSNNSASNLEWCTASENQLHACRKLGKRRGECAGLAKLTDDSVREMRRLREAGAMLKDIASRFGVGTSTVHAVVTRQTWTHVA